MTPEILDPRAETRPAPEPSRTRWEELAHTQNGRWQLAYQTCGDAGRPVVLLVMGLGTQMTGWPDGFCFRLADLGYRVIRLDNRDIGKSSRGEGLPNIPLMMLKATIGLRVTAPYRLRDMAGDAVAVLDAVDARQAHIIGASMGGMITQHLAASWPDRVASHVAIMTSSGRRGLPGPSADVRKLMLRRPDPNDRAAWIAHRGRVMSAINSPAYPDPPEQILAQSQAAYDRGAPHGPGTARQLAAIFADGSRVADLAKLRCPTLVIHGDRDPLVPLAAGLDVARAVPGAECLQVQGMGHHIPLAIEHLLAERIAAFVGRASR